MLIEDIRPSTLAGIKRLATRIKKQDAISHREALNRAAKVAGFENFEHANRALGNGAIAGGHRLYLTSYWRDDETYDIGRETLEISLAVSLPELCSKAEMKLVRGLCNMRLVAPDHLVRDRLLPSQHFAQDELCKTVRSLRFMEATGLRPCDYRRARSHTKKLDGELPEKDHVTEWHDPSTGQFILADEPYIQPIVHPERSDWARRNGWHLRASSWPGMYFPYQCGLFIASEASGEFDFDALMHKIDTIPDPVTAENWQGVSIGDHATFTSPLATTAQDKRRAKAKGVIVPRPSKKTMPYMRSLIGGARKPNGQMPLAEHEQAGRMTRALLQSQCKPWAVNERIDKMNSTLVDWLYADVSPNILNRMTDPVQLYYGELSGDDPYVVQASSTQGVQEILNNLAGLLKRAYPDCAPLRAMVSHIDRALKITRNAQPA